MFIHKVCSRLLERIQYPVRSSISRGLETMSGASFLDMDDKGLRRIAYRRVKSSSNNGKPGLIFIHGFQSNMDGSKGKYLERLAEEEGLNYVRFNLEGSMAEDKNLGELKFRHWVEDCLAVLDKLSEGPQIIVGSSLGGWLGIWTAIKRPERISGMVLVAPAINFVKYYYQQFYNMCPEEVKEILNTGVTYTLRTKYGPITLNKNFTESSQEFELDLEKTVSVKCPVRILHGMEDDAVPYKQSLKLLDVLQSSDVDIVYRKSGLHQLSTQEDLILLGDTIKNTFFSTGIKSSL